ncbi:MAG: chromosomal replication initiator protein DnaA, partial [Deltaproteobacteria bacterium]
MYWEKINKKLKEQLGDHIFDTWIAPIKMLSVENNVMRLSVPNKFFLDWITDNHLPIIKNIAERVIGTVVVVEFVVINAVPAKQSSTFVKTGAHRVQPALPTSLNELYDFDRFVIGPCNHFAHAAAVAVAEQPAKQYNPLFIYSDVGLGKTHLLHAIGLHMFHLHRDSRVLYISGQEMVNELINAIRYDKMSALRDKYRKMSCLLVDDIHFLSGKDRTQEEFFHIFNMLHDAGRQIVLTSDKFPKDIPNLEDRIKSRFQWGLIADIQYPDVETKIAILNKKAMESGREIPYDVGYYLASSMESNIRELEGCLKRIVAYSSIQNQPITIELAKEALKGVYKISVNKEIKIEEIVKVTANYYNVKMGDIKSQTKSKSVVLARQIAMYLGRTLTKASFPDIGEKVGGRDHSTVIYACKKIDNLSKNDISIQT